jgi:nitroreductase
MDTYQAITTRRTIRLFDPKPIPADLIDRILNAGRIAPSAANRQVLEFIVLREQANCERLFRQLAWAGYIRPRRTPPPGKQPTAYVIILVREEINPVNASDAAAAMENMILAAWNEGVGSCWIGSVLDRDVVRKDFDVPADRLIFGVLALGFPAEQPVMEELTDSVKYWLDENDRLHVPKRRLSEIVHREKFQPH